MSGGGSVASELTLLATVASSTRSSSPEMFSLPDSNLAASKFGTPMAAGKTHPTIPLKILPKAAPKMITTTKTLRRCCGFVLALFGCLFYCIRAVLVLVLLAWRLFFNSDGPQSQIDDYRQLAMEAGTCATGIFLFILIMVKPRLSLEYSNNFKNVFSFLLIPLLSWFRLINNCSPASFILPSIEGIFFTFYVYGLSLDGRSSSLWAGFKPFRFEPVPLILPIPPASKAFPQYTVPRSPAPQVLINV